MPRADLLALTQDDLVTLSNRGLVKRAVQEMEAGELTWELDEDDAGSVTAHWSDDVTCRLPAGKTLTEGLCTCPAVTLCRHLLRSVLAYQKAQAEAQAEVPAGAGEDAAPAEPPGPWDPGALSDDVLAAQIPKATLARSRRLHDEGHVVELARSRKPTATLHTLSCTVRFLVPGDVRYTHCDCSETAPCSHVALAVWAFRRLRPEAVSGLVSTHAKALPIPAPLLDDMENALRELATLGISGTAKPFADRLRRLEALSRADGLIWPAEILREMGQQWESYAGGDARFSPRRVAELVGELCIRLDAIRHEGQSDDEEAIPPLFVRGAPSDRTTDVGSARLIGLGCGVRVRRGEVEVAAYLQDLDSGLVVAVSRDFPDPPPDGPDAPRSFASLAGTSAVKGASLSALGAGQLLARGGKRTPEGRFLPGRTPASFQPQAFAWESLRAPTLVEDFAELQARLAARPPASLSPRRVAQNLYVCPVVGAQAARFLPAEQVTEAVLRDRAGGLALLRHPYLARGAAGTDALLARLQSQPEALRFVAGSVRAGEAGPVIAPLSLVFEMGGMRSLLQPWVEAAGGQYVRLGLGGRGEFPALPSGGASWGEYFSRISDQLGELFLTGLERADDQTARIWEELAEHGAALGFAQTLSPLKRMAEEIHRRRHTVRGDLSGAAGAALEAAVLLEMVREQLAPGGDGVTSHKETV